ncbi:MAG: electron transfer flavoprotein subunit alpha/FixB family protein [Chloroflexota bacterium]
MSGRKAVLVFAEPRDGGIHPVSFELLGKGKELADRLGIGLSSVILGDQLLGGERELIYYGADRVFLYEHPQLRDFDPLNYKHNIAKLIQELQPEIVLFGATHLGRSLAPRIAARLKTGLTADCTALELDDTGNLIQIRPAFTGNILAHIRTTTRPQMATVRYKVMSPLKRDTTRKGEIISREPELIPPLFTLLSKEKSGETDLPGAEVIVSGGRGLRKAEDFGLLAELARLLNGSVGSSRPLVDSGWISREHQVGFSGNTVRPRLYLACGISGSPQHLAGMRNSDIIIAINTDPSAPIFRFADYGIVGDLYEVVPELVSRLKRRQH